MKHFLTLTALLLSALTPYLSSARQVTTLVNHTSGPLIIHGEKNIIVATLAPGASYVGLDISQGPANMGYLLLDAQGMPIFYQTPALNGISVDIDRYKVEQPYKVDVVDEKGQHGVAYNRSVMDSHFESHLVFTPPCQQENEDTILCPNNGGALTVTISEAAPPTPADVDHRQAP